MTKIQDLEGIKLLPHPAYSPDLEPSDYHLFRSTAHFLRGRNFESIETVEVLLPLLRQESDVLFLQDNARPHTVAVT